MRGGPSTPVLGGGQLAGWSSCPRGQQPGQREPPQGPWAWPPRVGTLATPRGGPGRATPPGKRGHHRGCEQRTGTADLHLKGCFGCCIKSRHGQGVGGDRGQQREQTGERSRDSASSRAHGTQGVQGACRRPTDPRGWVLYAVGCTPLPTGCQQQPPAPRKTSVPVSWGWGGRTAS